MRTSFLLVLALATTARAATVTGQIDDPSLRRKTTLVYLEGVSGKFAPPSKAATMNQVRNTYSPHVLAVVAGQKVEFKSEDPELHNVYARAAKTTLFNQAVLPHKSFEKTFDKPGIVHLSCNVHREMSADILVLTNPFFAQPDSSGKFTIANVPEGKYTLRIFGDQLNDEQKAKTFTVTAGSAPVKVAAR
jgi:plastocyanin